MKKFLIFLFLVLDFGLLQGNDAGSVGVLPVNFSIFVGSPQQGDFQDGDSFIFLKTTAPKDSLFLLNTSSLPGINFNITLYGNNKKLSDFKLKNFISIAFGDVYGNNIDENLLKQTNKIEIIVSPASDILKDADVNDSGSLWDAGYKISLYDVSVTGGVSWEKSDIEYYPGRFYPWKNWDMVLVYVNYLTQIKNDIIAGSCDNDKEYLSNWWSFFNDPSDLQNDIKKDVDVMLDKFCSGNNYYKNKLLYALDSLAYVFFRDNIETFSVNFETYEYLWVWSNNFYDLIKESKSEELWDKSFGLARFSSLTDTNDNGELEIEKGVAAFQISLAKYYIDYVNNYSFVVTTDSVPESVISFVQGISYMFKWDIKNLNIAENPWDKYSDNYPSTVSEVVAPLYRFMINIEEQYMIKDETNSYSSETSFVFSEPVYELILDWVFENLSGDDYNNYRLLFAQWKSSVLIGNISNATDVRRELAVINDKLLQVVGR